MSYGVKVMSRGKAMFLAGFSLKIKRTSGRPAKVTQEALLTEDESKASRFPNELQAGYMALRFDSAMAVPLR